MYSSAAAYAQTNQVEKPHTRPSGGEAKSYYDAASPHINTYPPHHPGNGDSTSTNRVPGFTASDKEASNIDDEASRSRGLGTTLRKPRRTFRSSFVPSRSSAVFLAIAVLEAAAVIGLVVSVFVIVEVRTEVLTQDAKTVPVFLALFVFGMLFFIVIVMDAFRLHNTIQIVGCVVYNVALLVTAALEVTQVRSALQSQDRIGRGVPCPFDEKRRCGAVATLYPAIRPQLIATPAIIGAAQIPLTWLTFKLWQDFGWQVYKKIGADLQKRRMMLVYQIFVVMLKGNFFFGTAFCIAFLILVSDRADAEFGLTIAALPAALIVLFLSAWAVRKEIMSLMIFCILVLVAGLVYFVYKLTRIFAASTEDQYRTVRLTLTFFSIFAIICLAATIILAIWCAVNFGKGLKEAHESMGSLAQLLTGKNSANAASAWTRDSKVRHQDRFPDAIDLTDRDDNDQGTALNNAAERPMSGPSAKAHRSNLLAAPSHRTSSTTGSSQYTPAFGVGGRPLPPQTPQRKVSLD